MFVLLKKQRQCIVDFWARKWLLGFNTLVQRKLCLVIQPSVIGFGSLCLTETLDYFSYYIINLDILTVGKYHTTAIPLRKDFSFLNENVRNSLEGKVKRLKAKRSAWRLLNESLIRVRKREPKAERKENSMSYWQSTRVYSDKKNLLKW